MHIIPAAQQKELNGNISGTYVYMKTGKKLKELKEHLRKAGVDVYMAENCSSGHTGDLSQGRPFFVMWLKP